MPAALIVDAVDAGDIAQVAAVFDQAVAAGEVPQLVEILEEVRTAITAKALVCQRQTNIVCNPILLIAAAIPLEAIPE